MISSILVSNIIAGSSMSGSITIIKCISGSFGKAISATPSVIGEFFARVVSVRLAVSS